MKILFTYCIILWSIHVANGQVIERDIFSSTGNSAIANSIQMDFTIGESIINDQNLSPKLSQGFQQGDGLTTYVVEIENGLIHLDLYPNPSSDFLNIQYEGEEINNWKVTLFDIKGTVVRQQEMKTTFLRLDLRECPPGKYFLRFYNPEFKNVFHVGLIKI